MQPGMTFQPAKSFQKETWHPHSPLGEEDSVTFLLPCLALWRNSTPSHFSMLRHATRNCQAIVSHAPLKEKGTKQHCCVLRPAWQSPQPACPGPGLPSLLSLQLRKVPLPAPQRLGAGAGIVGLSARTRQEAACGRPRLVSMKP